MHPPPAADELLSAAEVRAQLSELLATIPHGSKAALARALGFHGRWARNTLRLALNPHTQMDEPRRRRLSSGLQQFARGELALVPTGRRHGQTGHRYTVVRHFASVTQ